MLGGGWAEKQPVTEMLTCRLFDYFSCGEWCGEAERGYDDFHRNPLKLLVGSTGLEPVAPAV